MMDNNLAQRSVHSRDRRSRPHLLPQLRFTQSDDKLRKNVAGVGVIPAIFVLDYNLDFVGNRRPNAKFCAPRVWDGSYRIILSRTPIPHSRISRSLLVKSLDAPNDPGVGDC